MTLPTVGETKLPEFSNFMKEFAQALFGVSAEQGTCWMCGREGVKAEDFRDEESLQEYRISGMCQECQDKTFGGAAALAALLPEPEG